MSSSATPQDRLYSADHEWVAVTTVDDVPAEPARVGISQLAADSLGELVYLDLPAVGSEVSAGQPCGEVESTKSVSELVSPVSGTVTETNDSAADEPAVVTHDPYGAGWLFAVQVTGFGALMTAAEYAHENGLPS